MKIPSTVTSSRTRFGEEEEEDGEEGEAAGSGRVEGLGDEGREAAPRVEGVDTDPSL